MTLTKPISDVVQGNPISSTYKPKASELSTLLTEMREEYLPDTTPVVILALGTSNLVGVSGQTSGDHTIESDVYAWDTNMNPATVVAGTQWVTPTFGSAPFNIGSSPYANSAALHFANQVRRRTNRPVYLIIIGKPSTVIEAWIKPATLATNGWSTGGAQDMTALMYPGIANALAAVPGSPTQIDYLFLSHGSANVTELPETVAKKAVASVTDLGSLIDLTQTPIIQHEQCHSDAAPYRMRHLAMLYRMQEDLPTLRIARSWGLEPYTASNIHFAGEALVQLGHRMEALAHLPPERRDYRIEPLLLGPNDGLAFFTNSTNAAEWDFDNRPAHTQSNPITMVDDASLGWCYETTANNIYIFYTRRIFPVIPNGVAKIAIEALAPDVGATVDINLLVHQWDIDGVSLGAVTVTPANSPFTDAMGAAVVQATFGVTGTVADGTLSSSAAYYAFGVSLGVGANDEKIRFKFREMSMSAGNTFKAHSAGTLALAMRDYERVSVTPNALGTFTSTVPPAGSVRHLTINTSGTTSYTMTFGTGFKSQGTLATGTTSGKVFALAFLSDGASLIEIGARGAAM